MIKPKNTAPTLPQELERQLDQAFRYSVVAKQYQALADQARGEVQTYLESATDLSIEAGKGFAHPRGTVIYSTRENYRIDTDQLIELVKSGAISIESIVNLAFPEGKVSKVEPLKIALGSKFQNLATVTTSNYITLRPTPDFKGAIAAEFPELQPEQSDIPSLDDRDDRLDTTGSLEGKTLPELFEMADKIAQRSELVEERAANMKEIVDIQLDYLHSESGLPTDEQARRVEELRDRNIAITKIIGPAFKFVDEDENGEIQGGLLAVDEILDLIDEENDEHQEAK